ncbi:MAG: pilus assembly protein TadG-related protein [Dehalococcoidales bacterium]|nr:pilus assembly protein TadG-related protein [Dehalococcoidales bacterium]
MFGKRRDLIAAERGQVLVIFALAVTVLLGAVALAVDAGQTYATKRHLQNVADQAALVGGQSLNGGDPEGDAIANAQLNDPSLAVYDPANPDADCVRASIPPTAGPFAGQAGYLEVITHKRQPTAFARVFGQGRAVVTARAVVRTQGLPGNGVIIALSHRISPPALTIDGTAAVTINGDLWSNGLIKSNSSSTDIELNGTAVTVGGLSPADLFPADQTINYEGWLPDPLAGTTPPCSGDCSGYAPEGYTDTFLSGWTTYHPGRFDSITVGPSEKARFLPGVYVTTKSQGVSIKGVAIGTDQDPGDPLTWDLGNPDSPYNTPPADGSFKWGPVSFYLANTGATFTVNSSATARFQADDIYFKNIVVWSLGDNPKGIEIEGGANAAFVGTLYAPAGDIKVAGGTVVPTVRGQIIGDTISVGGSTGVVVEYVENAAADWQKVVLVE